MICKYCGVIIKYPKKKFCSRECCDKAYNKYRKTQEYKKEVKKYRNQPG